MTKTSVFIIWKHQLWSFMLSVTERLILGICKSRLFHDIVTNFQWTTIDSIFKISILQNYEYHKHELSYDVIIFEDIRMEGRKATSTSNGVKQKAKKSIKERIKQCLQTLLHVIFRPLLFVLIYYVIFLVSFLFPVPFPPITINIIIYATKILEIKITHFTFHTTYLFDQFTPLKDDMNTTDIASYLPSSIHNYIQGTVLVTSSLGHTLFDTLHLTRHYHLLYLHQYMFYNLLTSLIPLHGYLYELQEVVMSVDNVHCTHHSNVIPTAAYVFGKKIMLEVEEQWLRYRGRDCEQQQQQQGHEKYKKYDKKHHTKHHKHHKHLYQHQHHHQQGWYGLWQEFHQQWKANLSLSVHGFELTSVLLPVRVCTQELSLYHYDDAKEWWIAIDSIESMLVINNTTTNNSNDNVRWIQVHDMCCCCNMIDSSLEGKIEKVYCMSIDTIHCILYQLLPYTIWETLLDTVIILQTVCITMFPSTLSSSCVFLSSIQLEVESMQCISTQYDGWSSSRKLQCYQPSNEEEEEEDYEIIIDQQEEEEDCTTTEESVLIIPSPRSSSSSYVVLPYDDSSITLID